LLEAGIKISVDGKGCWMDNIFVEGLWRSLKYEEIYHKAFRQFQKQNQEVMPGLNSLINFESIKALDI
jgi:putative transposase